jgi:multidrug resistance efflux pump
MEILFTVAYIFLIRLVFFDYKWLKFNLWWGIALTGFYAMLIMLEIIMLGQVAPFSKEASVQGYSLSIQAQWPGFIKEVCVESNVPIKKGAPLFKMDDTQWKARLVKQKAELAQAQRLLEDAIKLTPSGAMAKEKLLLRQESVDKFQAEVYKAQFNVNHSTIYAPADGYIPILQIYPGVFHGLINKKVFSFICTDNLWMVMKVNQQAVRFIKPGDKVEATLSMYPGKIFKGSVISVIWGVGNTQVTAGSKIPDDTITPANDFFVKIKIDNEPETPIRYGAKAMAVIYTKKASLIFQIIRKIEIRSEAFLNYIYNPF